MFPVTIKQLSTCQDNFIQFMGVKSDVFTFVGLVTDVESSPSKTSVTIDDQTGVITASDYVDVNGEGFLKMSPPVKGTYCRVVGVLRGNVGSKYIKILNLSTMTDLNDLTCHILEVHSLPAKLDTMLNNMEKLPSGGRADGLPKSKHKGMHNIVLSMVRDFCSGGEMDLKNVAKWVKNRLSEDEVLVILNALMEEGLVFMVNEKYFANR